MAGPQPGHSRCPRQNVWVGAGRSLGHEDAAPVMGREPFLNRLKAACSSLSLHYMRAQQENGHLLTRERPSLVPPSAGTRPWPCQPPKLGKICLLFKPRSLWYLVTAAWTDKDTPQGDVGAPALSPRARPGSSGSLCGHQGRELPARRDSRHLDREHPQAGTNGLGCRGRSGTGGLPHRSLLLLQSHLL